MNPVKCTLTMKTNKLQSILMIGETGHTWWWNTVGGQFTLAPVFGHWAYIDNDRGIGLSYTTEDVPRFNQPDNLVAVLFKVPDRFLEKVLPGRPLSGEGIIRFSNLGLLWELRYP
jgi:hypothetical protein